MVDGAPPVEVRMTLTLSSGAQVSFDTHRREADDVRAAVVLSWRSTAEAAGPLSVGTDEVTDWLRMAAIDAVQIVPLPGHPSPTVGPDGPAQSEQEATL